MNDGLVVEHGTPNKLDRYQVRTPAVIPCCELASFTLVLLANTKRKW